jgi:hypothetical protein
MLTMRVVVAGLVASVVMGMLEMLYEAVAGAGFWSPIVFIAATILRDLQAVTIPVPFLPVPVVLGLMGHMMNSVILGIIFAVFVAPRIHGFGGLVAVGVVWSLVVFALMWFVVVPLVDPVMLKLNGTFFAIAHMMWGAVLGVALGWKQTATLQARTAH